LAMIPVRRPYAACCFFQLYTFSYLWRKKNKSLLKKI
jgi:hypothetical protein